MVSFLNQAKTQLIPDGYKFFAGLDQVLITNIQICNYLKNITKTSFGPNAKNKLIIHKTGKFIITSDTFTILKNLDFSHPAIQILIFSAIYQIQELGDFANYLILFCTEILKQAYDLLKIGYNSYEIIKNFEEAGKISLKILETLPIYKFGYISNLKILSNILALSIKLENSDLKNIIAPQIAYACLNTCPVNLKRFSNDNIRVVKILGGNTKDIKTLIGTVILKDSEGSVKTVKKANIAIYNCEFDFSNIETKNSIEFSKIQDILKYEKNENFLFERKIKNILTMGINVIVANRFGDLALHFFQKYNIMAIKIQSKFDMKRIAKTSNSLIISNLRIPKNNEIGKCDFVTVRSFGFQKVTIFKQELTESKIFTVIIRANSTSLLDNLEKNIQKLTIIFKSIIRDDRFILGAGSSEIQLVRRIKNFSIKKESIFNPRIIEKFADSFEIIPSTLIENSGDISMKLLSKLHIKHKNEEDCYGIDSENYALFDCKKNGIWDLFSCKYWAIKNAIDAALTILTVDQIVMAKQFTKDSEK
jgi:T-complex protein 1 subunit theta